MTSNFVDDWSVVVPFVGAPCLAEDCHSDELCGCYCG